MRKQLKQIRRNADYDRLRANLVRRGQSLHHWAKKNGYRYTSVVSAARGERHGQLSRKIRAELAAEL